MVNNESYGLLLNRCVLVGSFQCQRKMNVIGIKLQSEGPNHSFPVENMSDGSLVSTTAHSNNLKLIRSTTVQI